MTEFNKHLNMTLEECLEEHVGLVRMVANRCMGRFKGVAQIEDLEQMAYIGMVKAFRKYDPDGYNNSRFSTYAVPTMIGEIQRFYRDGTIEMVKFPRIFKEIWGRVKKMDLEDESNERIAELTGFPLDKVTEAMEWYDRKQAYSLDWETRESKEGDGATVLLIDKLGFHEDFSSVMVNEFLNRLTDKERIVLTMYAEGYQQREIGPVIGVSQVQVSRILAKIKTKGENYFKVAG